MDMAMFDQRRASRRRLLLDGKIVTLNKMSLIDCAVKDLSATGARLRCKDMRAVPDEFRLWVPSTNLYRIAKLVWRQDIGCGIVFTGPPEPPPDRKWLGTAMIA